MGRASAPTDPLYHHQWYDRPMPPDWQASHDEWLWACYRLRGKIVQPPGEK